MATNVFAEPTDVWHRSPLCTWKSFILYQISIWCINEHIKISSFFRITSQYIAYSNIIRRFYDFLRIWGGGGISFKFMNVVHFYPLCVQEIVDIIVWSGPMEGGRYFSVAPIDRSLYFAACWILYICIVNFPLQLVQVDIISHWNTIFDILHKNFIYS